MSDLGHIAYVSFSHKPLENSELESLLVEIRKKNKLQNITGLLLYNDQSFIQVVEGEISRLRKLFERISRDGRHENIVKLVEEPIEKRAFPNWSMGFKNINKKQAGKIPGFSKFMISDNPQELVKGSTREIMKLLNSFRRYT